jgi:site-specific DNA recombinase
LERSRRGKRHRALQGVVNVLCGAPYGYRYIRKTEHAPASYAIIDAEATVVRRVYEYYTVAGLSIGAITRLLNEQGVPTRKRISRWERSVVWAMLRNPAYKGTACFNKTKTAKRQRITRPIRLRGGFASRDSAHHERPQEEWIEIAVPPIVTEETFALAAERLQANKDHAPRRTITPSVVQGLVSCRKCSYGLYRTSSRTSARMIYYYRCLGSDAWRRLGGPVCDSKPIRQDLLDEVVWREILKLLESPHLIQEELERRLAAARNASPAKQREETLQREVARVRKSMERLMTAYQEDLMSLDDLRRRMPELRKREQAISAELNAIESQLADRAWYLRLAETVTGFLARLRETAKTLDVAERQRIVRLLVKEILVDDDTIVIRHSIPAPTKSTDGSGPTSRSKRRQSPGDASYLLRKGSNLTDPLEHLPAPRAGPVVRERGATAPEGKRDPGAVRRRLRDDLRDPPRRQAGSGSAGETAWTVRPHAAPGQDALHRLPAAAHWWHAPRLQGPTVRLPRLDPHVGKVAEWQERGAATDGQEPFCPPLTAIKDWCQKNRHRPMREQCAQLSAALAGHYAYYGITGNFRRLRQYRQEVTKTWHKWLESRTRKKGFTWDRFNAFLARHPLPRARITRRYTTWNEALA